MAFNKNLKYHEIKEKAKGYLLQKNYEDSIILYKQCEGFLNDEVCEAREKSVIYLNICICFMNLKKNIDAESYADKAIECDGSYVKAYYRKAILLKLNEKYEEALEICKNAMKIEKNQEIFMIMKEIKELFEKKLKDKSFIWLKKLLITAKNEYDYKLIIAEIMNKFENSEDCLKVLQKDEESLIKDLLCFFDLKPVESQNSDFFIKILCYFAKKAQEIENNLFFNKEHGKLIINLLRKNSISEKNKENFIKVYPFFRIDENSQILELVLQDYEKNPEFFWKNCSFYLTFFFRNSLYLEKNQEKTNFSSEKILQFYQGVLQEKIKKKSENTKNFNEMLIILMRLLFIKNKAFLSDSKKLEEINDDFSFCLECFICLNANFEISQRFFENHGIYVKIIQNLKKFSFEKNKLIRFFVLHFSEKEIIEVILDIFTLLVKDKEAISQISNNNEIKNFKESLKSLFHLIGVPNIRLRICLIFLKLYYNRKEKEIIEFNELFDVSLVKQIVFNLSQLSDVFQTVELLSHLTCFDLYKLDLIKELPSLKQLFNHINEEILKKTMKELSNSLTVKESDYFNLFLGILHISFNLCLDKKQEMVDHYKRNYEISDEDFNAFEDMQRKYNQDAYNEGVQFMKYDQKAIKQYGVKAFISKEVKICQFLSFFIENFQKNLSFNIKVSMIKLLVSLSVEKENISSLFDIKILKFLSGIAKPETFDLEFNKFQKLSFEFLSRSLAHCNPKLFTYADSMNFTLNLIEALRESGEEIIIFEATLGLIQFSSLGEHIIQIFRGKGVLNTIQNNLLETNEFIIHSSLELLINIFSQDQDFQINMNKGNLLQLNKILFALYSKYHDELCEKKGNKGDSDYIETKSILKTFFILFALGSNFKPLKKLLILNKIYDYVDIRKLLTILSDNLAKEEFISITQNLIYLWKNSKKRSQELLKKFKEDFKQNFFKTIDSSILKEFD